MSYIHEALKKAQKERGGSGYSAVRAEGPGACKGRPKSHAVRTGVAIGIALIFLAFALYSWLDFSPAPEETSLKVREEKRPVAALFESDKSDDRYREKALDLLEKGRISEAEASYREALERDPGDPVALNNLAVLNMQKGRLEEAQGLLEKAVRLEPGGVDPHYNLACLYARKKDLDRSMAHLLKAIAIDPAVGEWAGKDEDLEVLRGISRFEKLIRKE